MIYDVIVIGAGPAGIAAAIQLKRSDSLVCILESNEVGGLLHHAHCVENFPGYAGGISGCELAQRLEAHLNALKIEIRCETATGLEALEQSLLISTRSGDYEAQYVIAATGTQPRKWCDFDLPSAVESRMFYDPRDAAQTRGALVIVGGGDAAFDYALRLAESHEVTIVYRNHPRALPLLIRRAEAHPNIRCIGGFVVKAIEATEDGMQIISDADSVEAAAVLMALGRVPAMGIAGADESFWRSHPRVHWTGDVINGLYRQAAIAAGDGLRTAMKVCERLEGNI